MRDTKPKRFVFVLMPFHESFDDVYKLGIKPACEAAGAYCERVDEQIFQESILERIYNQIAKADLIVSDMTGRNPNVFYETGYAHALGKKVILLTQQTDDIPFDLQHYPHIVYGGKIVSLKEELDRRVSWHLSQPDTSLFEPHTQLQFFTHGQRISDGVEVTIPRGDYSRSAGERVICTFRISVHNPSNRAIDAQGVYLALILPSTAQPLAVSHRDIRLPDGKLLTEPAHVGLVLPQAWGSNAFSAVLGGELFGKFGEYKALPCTLRIFSPTGVTDIPFHFCLESEEEFSFEWA